MERRTPPRSYTYNKISQLSYGMKRVNVIGAVQHFRAPAKTRRSDYSCAIGIADESSNQSMTCVLFNKELQKLPGGCKDGDIICVRRCDFSDSCLTGSSFTSWVLFQDGNSIPVTSSPNCTVSAIERTRVHELRAWRELSNTSQGGRGSFTGMYFKLFFVSVPHNYYASVPMQLVCVCVCVCVCLSVCLPV